MPPGKEPQLPQIGTPVATPCGGMLTFNLKFPRTRVRDEWVYFCLPACLRAYEADPQTSCLQDGPHRET